MPQAVAFDPLLVLALVSIAISAARLALACTDTRSKAAAWLTSPGFFGRLKLRRIVNRELSQRGLSNHAYLARKAILSSLPDEERALSLLGEAWAGTPHEERAKWKQQKNG